LASAAPLVAGESEFGEGERVVLIVWTDLKAA
jgi:hypothetical protein